MDSQSSILGARYSRNLIKEKCDRKKTTEQLEANINQVKQCPTTLRVKILTRMIDAKKCR